MNPMSQSETATQASGVKVNKSRLILLLIAGIPVTIILASTWLWYFVIQGDLDIVGSLGTANRGTLVQPPRPIADARLTDQQGARFSFSSREAKWTLLVPVQGAVCDAACEQRLYLTRQIHVAMGKELTRLQRAYVGTAPVAATALRVATRSDDGPAPDSFVDYLQGSHLGMFTLQAPSQAFADMFPEFLAAPSTWYLMDPAGWVMMSYDDSVSYKDVISDLKFLLKNSNG